MKTQVTCGECGPRVDADIAADLLAALEAAISATVPILPQNYRSIGGEPQWVTQARAAIKKARGE
jgi:hypothetical protein